MTRGASVEVETATARPKVFRRTEESFRRALRRFEEPARRARELFPLTPVGLVVGAGAGLALLWYGLKQLDLVLLVLGAGGLALLLLSLLSVTITAFVLWRRLRHLPSSDGEVRVECGATWQSGFSLRHLWFVPLVDVSWEWHSPKAEVEVELAEGRQREVVLPRHRALSDTIVRRLSIADSFGLTEVRFSIRQRRPLRFLPSKGALNSVEVVRAMAGGEDLSHPEGPPEGERVDLRSYQNGDPVRFIMWKVFARTRQVVVRTPEHAIAPVRQTVAYLVTGPGDEAAAGAARVAVEGGALGGDWVFGVDGDVEPIRSLDAALAAIARSRSLPEKEWGAGLQRFLRKASLGAMTTRALVFAPARPGPWIDRVVAASSNLGPSASLEVMLCCDGVEGEARRGRITALLTEREEPVEAWAERPVSTDELSTCLRKLSAARAQLAVVDRRTGRVYDHSRLGPLLRAA